MVGISFKDTANIHAINELTDQETLYYKSIRTNKTDR